MRPAMTFAPTYIIAEAGVNHNGSLERARQLVRSAAQAGADAVKFQTFRAERLVTADAPRARYQEDPGAASQSQYGMLKALELDEAAHDVLARACVDEGLDFLSTPFDIDSLHMLVVQARIARIKLSSGDLTNGPLLLAAARTGLPIILSTGMATLGEVEDALCVLAFGYLHAEDTPDRARLRACYLAEEAQAILRDRVTLLHCTSEYPTVPQDVNLRAMDTLRDAFGLAVGYSDHTTGIAVPIAAVARGAAVVEKHFTLDRALPGPDHRASLEPADLAAMVGSIREVEVALGQAVKAPTPGELAMRGIARRSLTAIAPIRPGEPFSPANMDVRRPGDGVSPMQYWEYLGRPADRAYDVDEQIS